MPRVAAALLLLIPALPQPPRTAYTPRFPSSLSPTASHTSPSPSLSLLLCSGRNFGSYVTHETKNFIYFYLGQVAILLFKSG